MRTALLILGTAVLAATPARAQAPVGDEAYVLVRVSDQSTRAPVNHAEVWVGESRVTTDVEGHAVLPVRHERERLLVRRIGYLEERREITGDETPVDVQLAPAPLPMSTVAARTRRKPLSPPLQGFYDRVRGGRGAFLTREQIEARHPRRLTDLFREIAGVRVLLGPEGERLAMDGATPSLVRGGRWSPGECPVQYYLDGNSWLPDDAGVPNDVLPDEVEGIEVYRRISEVPVAFRRPGAECGVVLIWLRETAD